MKKSLIMMSLTAAIGFGAQPALAGDAGAGCGLGKVVMEGKSGKGANIAAGILNVFPIANTFFMTTAATTGDEILGCDTSTTVMNEANKKAFVANNMDNLSRDMAQGSGVHLEALADVMGVAEEDKDAFYSMTQDEYVAFSASDSASADDVLANLNTAMLAYPELAKYTR